MKTFTKQALRLGLVTLIAAISLPTHAANRYWDISAVGQPGDGLQGGTAAFGSNWSTLSSGTALTAFVNGDNLFFQVGTTKTYSVNNGAGRTIGSITVDNANFVSLNNGTGSTGFAMNIAGPITIQGASSFDIDLKNWNVQGTPSATIQDGSTFSFTYGSNITSSKTFDFATLSFGAGANTLKVNNGSAGVAFNMTATSLAGDSDDAINLGTSTSDRTTLTINNADSSSFAGVISGTGNLIKTGTGSMTLTAGNTYTGNTTVSGGVLDVSGAGAQLYNNASSVAAVVTVNNGGVLVVKNFGKASDNSTSLGNLNNGGGQVVLDDGTLRFNGETGARGRVLNINAGGGTLDVVNSSAYTMNGASIIIAGSPVITLTGDVSSSGTIQSTIGGAASLVKTGSAIWTLTGANTYSRGTTLDAGQLNIGATTALGSSSGTLTVNGGTLNLQTYNVTVGNFSGSGGTITGVGNTLTVTQSADATYAGTLINSLALVKAGSAALTLTGANTFSGALAIDNGTLAVPNTSALGNGSAITLGTGSTVGTLQYTGSNGTISQNITAASGGPGGIIQNTTASTVLTLDGALSKDGTTLTFQGPGAFVVNGIISGAAANSDLVVNGGTTTLNAQNTYSGNTYVYGGGVLNSGTLNALPTNTILNLGSLDNSAGKYRMNGFNQTIAGLQDTGAGANSVVNDSVTATTLTINNTSNYTFGGVLGGAGANEDNFTLTKTGSGVLTLSGANTYSGGTTLSAGTLAAGHDSALGSGNLTVSGNSTLATAGGARTLGNTITTSATLNFNTANGNLTLTGPVSTTGGTAELTKSGANDLIIQSSLTLNNPYGWDITGGRLVIDGGAAVNTSDGIRLSAPAGQIVELVITNGGSYIIGTTGGTPNLQLGNTATAGSTNYFRISSGSFTLGPTAGNINVGSQNNTYGEVFQTGGTVSGNVNLGNSGSGSRGVYNLDGGWLINVKVAKGAGAGTFNFNGGTLQASGGTTSFMTGLTAAYIKSGGAIIDSSTFAVTIGQNLLDGGGGDLTKLGSGTLTLSGANTYGGATVINAGVLVASGGSAIPDLSAVSLANVAGATLLLNASETIGSLAGGGGSGGAVNLQANTLTTGGNNTDTTFSGIISGTGNLIKTGTGTMTLTAGNTYTGDTTVSGGILDISGVGAQLYNNASAVSGSSVTVSGGGVLVVKNFGQGSGTSTSLGNLNNSSAEVTLNGGTLRVSGDDGSARGRAVTIGANGGTIEVASGSYTMGTTSIANSYTANSTLTLSGTGTGQMDKRITGSGVSLIKADAGSWSLTGTSTFSGNTTINGGTLDLRNGQIYAGSGTYATQVVTVGSGTTLRVQNFGKSTGTGTSLGNLNLDAGRVIVDGGTIQFNTTVTNGRGITVGANGAVLSVASGVTWTQNASNPNVYTAGATLTLGGAGTGQLDNTIDGTGISVIKSDTGTWTLTGANTYSGTTTVNMGVLAITSASALGTITGNTVVNSGNGTTAGGQLQVSGGITVNEPLTIIGEGNGAYNGALLSTGGNNTWSGAIQIDPANSSPAGSNRINVTAGSLLITGGITGPAGENLTLNSGTTLTVSTNPITLAGGAVVNSHGAGTTVLNVGGNTFGVLNVQYNNTFKLGVNDAVPTTADLVLGSTAANANAEDGTFDLNGFSQTVDQLGSGTAAGVPDSSFANTGGTRKVTSSVAGAVTLTVGNNNGSSLFDGVIQNGSGTVALTKVGNGMQTLAGANTYTGDTTVSGGKLTLANANALQSSTLNYNNSGGTLSFGSLTSATLGGLKGSQDLVLENADPTAMALTVGNNNQSTTYDGTLGGSGAITKIGTGALTLNGNSGFSGGSTLGNGTANTSTSATATSGSGGFLVVGHNNALGTGTITMAGAQVRAASTGLIIPNSVDVSGGGFRFGGANDLTFSGPVALVGAARTIGTYGNATLTLNGTLSGAFSMTKDGTGRLILNGNNSFTGGSTLGNGTANTSTSATATSGSGGFLVVGHNNALGTGTITMAGTQVQAGIAGLTIGNAVTVDSGGFRFGGANDLTFTGTTTLVGGNRTIGNYSGTQTLTLGNIATGGDDLTFEATNAAANNGTIVVNGNITGGGTLTVQNNYDNGTVILLGANSYARTTVSAGRLQVGNGGTTGTLGTGTITINDTGELVLNRSNGLTVNRQITFSGGLGTLTVQAGANSFQDTSSGGTTSIQLNSGATATVAVNSGASADIVENIGFSGTPTLILTGAGTGTITGTIASGGAAGSVIKNGPGTWVFTVGNNWGTGDLTINNGILRLSAIEVIPHGSGKGNVVINSGTLELMGTTETVNGLTLVSGTISDSVGGAVLTASSYDMRSGAVFTSLAGSGVALTKSTSGTVALYANNSYTGATTITGGVLALEGSAEINGTSLVQINGGTFRQNSTTPFSGTITFGGSGGTISGTGVIDSSSSNPGTYLSVGSNAVLSPGNSPAGQNYVGTMNWADGGKYIWEINNWHGVASNNWDFIDLDGALNFAGLTSNFTIEVVGLTLANTAGLPESFVRGESRSFPILNSGFNGIDGSFDSGWFTINTTGFPSAPYISWTLTSDGNTLWLNYTAMIPEPTTVMLLGLGGLLLLLGRRLRNSQSR